MIWTILFLIGLAGVPVLYVATSLVESIRGRR